MRRLIFAASPLSRVMLRHSRPLHEIYRESGRLADNPRDAKSCRSRELSSTMPSPPPMTNWRSTARLLPRGSANGATQPPVTLDDIWAAISGSPYLALLGCRVLPDRGTRGIELNHIPEVADGTVRTVSREAYERGLPDDTPLRFASYGDPAFEAILGLVKASGIPPGICRVAVSIPGIDDAELVGYVAMCRMKNGEPTHRVFLEMTDLENLSVEGEVPVPPAAIEDLHERLRAVARNEFGLLEAVPRIEAANETAGRAQGRLTRLVAKHFILSMQAARRSDTNFARQLAILDELAEDPRRTAASENAGRPAPLVRWRPVCDTPSCRRERFTLRRTAPVAQGCGRSRCP
jgi:hypothetical protein